MPNYNSYLRLRANKRPRKAANSKRENESKIVFSSQKKEVENN
jgi:hypothetical protein